MTLLQNPHVLLTFDKVHNPLRLPCETTPEPPKVVRTWCAFNILTSKCASRHNSVHFFDISTSKSGPDLVFFVHFDFEMCFAPQRCALFRHRNFQKWSEHVSFLTFDFEMCFAPQQRALFRHLNFQKCSEGEVFLAFSLANVLRATTACNFSSLSHLASWLRTRRFSEPTFRPSGATNHWKNTMFRDFLSFSRTWIFFLLRLSLL